MSAYSNLLVHLSQNPGNWLITGVAGFIGSNLAEHLLKAGQKVTGLDNFSTGHPHNLEMLRKEVGEGNWKNFSFVEGDIRNLHTCRMVCEKTDYVLHQAAQGSVPRSIEDPILANANNIDGFLNMMVAARDAGVKRFVYAASSSTYGDEPTLPKVEDRIGKPLSPYAVTKYVNELYADVFFSAYGFRTIGLRYFNIFGQRQDPEGAYAAVIPQWFSAILRGKPIFINGDGETSRDFCYIDNCVQANLLAACSNSDNAWNQVYNIACGERITLNELFDLIRAEVSRYKPDAADVKPQYRDFRAGDVRHSLADIGKASSLLGYEARFKVKDGLRLAGDWYAAHL